jgi:hypothetical protein
LVTGVSLPAWSAERPSRHLHPHLHVLMTDGAFRRDETFVLLDAGPAKLEVFDVPGRRVLTRDLTALAAGRRTVTLGEGRALSPGIYVLRLSQVGREASARVVTLD